MKLLRRIISKLVELFKDLFYTTDNESLDLARVLAFSAVAAELAAVRHNMLLKQPIDLGPSGLGGGISAILAAAAGFLAAKAWSKKKNRESAAIAQNTAVAVEGGEPVVEVAPPVQPVATKAPSTNVENIEKVEMAP